MSITTGVKFDISSDLPCLVVIVRADGSGQGVVVASGVGRVL